MTKRAPVTKQRKAATRTPSPRPARSRAAMQPTRRELAAAQAELDRAENARGLDRARAAAKGAATRARNKAAAAAELAAAQRKLDRSINAEGRRQQAEVRRQVRGMAGALTEIERYLEASERSYAYRPEDSQGKFKTAIRFEVAGLTYREAARALDQLADHEGVANQVGSRYVLWAAEASHRFRGGMRRDDREWTLNHGDSWEPGCARAGVALVEAADKYGRNDQVLELVALTLYLSDEDGW